MIININSKSDLLNFLKGKNGSSIPCTFGDLPTDPIKVTDRIKEKFINEEEFRGLFLECIIELSNDERYSWLSLYYLFSILRVIKSNKMQTGINSSILAIENGIKKNEMKLKVTFDWGGNLYTNGIWEDVERMARIISEEFGFRIYPNTHSPNAGSPSN